MSTNSPETHKSSVVKPADFDIFWDETCAEMEKVTMEPRLEPVPMRSTPEVEAFEAHYRSYGGLEIAGWYARPRGANLPLPGLLQVPGYAGEPAFPSALARLGYAVFSTAPRGKLRSNGVFNPGYPGLLTHNIDDRDNYGYRGFYMDALRAFDFLAALPEVRLRTYRRVGVEPRRRAHATGVVTAGREREGSVCGRPVSVFDDRRGLSHTLLPLRGDQRLLPPLPRTV